MTWHPLSPMIVFCLLLSACTSQTQQTTPPSTTDRFANQFCDLHEIASLRQLTTLERDHPPIAVVDKKVYFRRLVWLNPADSLRDSAKVGLALVALDVVKQQLLLARELPTIPSKARLHAEELPEMAVEKADFGYRTPYGIFFQASQGGNGYYANVFFAKDDSLAQITYGLAPTYLRSVSSSGRYLAFLYGAEFPRLLVYDAQDGQMYALPRDSAPSALYEAAPMFLESEEALVFLSADRLSPHTGEPMGNLWLVEFNRPSK